MTLSLDKDVLLFYAGYERDVYFKGDRHLFETLEKVAALASPGTPKTTGFGMWFELLCRGLRRCGVSVHVNRHRLARRNPAFPIGVCGHPWILDEWELRNPAVLGPGMLDHPAMRPALMSDPRFRCYVTTCDWNHDLFVAAYGAERCVHWHAGIDLGEWQDAGSAAKEVDILLYDKVRWRRPHFEETLIGPIRQALHDKRMRVKTLRYGRYDLREYRRLLLRSKAMLFLCEHETQGMAYQEALACNVPVLAWNPGVWMDPQAAKWDAQGVVANSVPFFDSTCGTCFRNFEEFGPALQLFWTQLDSFRPRTFVQRCLSLEESGRTYLKCLARAAEWSA